MTRKGTVVKRIDVRLDLKIRDIQQSLTDVTGKEIKYCDASKLIANSLDKPTIIFPLKKRKGGGLLDGILDI